MFRRLRRHQPQYKRQIPVLPVVVLSLDTACPLLEDDIRLDNNLTTLAQWLAYLEQLHPKTIDMGLERVNQVRDVLKLKPSFPVIIVGGTNGKGSVCAILEAILTAAGYYVGCYSSPHLLRYNERIRLRQKEASDQQIIQAFIQIEQARKQCGTSLTYFEFGTLAAMDVFMTAQVDVAILEVGLGGRLDAVNVFEPDCAVVTNVERDHMDYLGDTREAIGVEKAGIFRKNKPAICADADVPASVLQYANEIGAQLALIHQDFGFVCKTDHWDFWSQNGQRYTLPFPRLLGSIQVQNACVSIVALEKISHRLPVSTQMIREGLLSATLPGRFQVLSNAPMVILDVAHNLAAAAIHAENLDLTRPTGKTFAIFTMLHDKEISSVMQVLKKHIDVWLLAPINAERGASIHQLRQNLDAAGVTRESHTIKEFDNAVAAYVYACNQANNNDRICVLGSFYTVGAVLQYLEKEKNQ